MTQTHEQKVLQAYNAIVEKYGVDEDGKISGIKHEDLIITSGMLQEATSSSSQGEKKKKKKPSYDVDEIPEPPQGFTLVEESYFEHDRQKGVKPDIRRFKDFNLALTELNADENPFRGITKTSRGYELRVGRLRQQNPRHTNGSIASYVRTNELNRGGECSGIIRRITKHKHTGGEGVVISESEGSSSEEVEEKEEEPVVKPERKKKKKKGMKFNNRTKKEPEPEPEPEEEAEELDVEPIEIEGKKYFYHAETNNIYDPDTSEEVGIKNDEGEYVLN